MCVKGGFAQTVRDRPQLLDLNGSMSEWPCALSRSCASGNSEPRPRVSHAGGLDVKVADGISLKGTYFAAGKAGPGVLLVHQSDRNRKSWNSVAVQLAAAGINALTIDMRRLW